ncbi:toxin-antitoxin system YwqK family antitoxin [Larkinella sp. C7]|jgi:antitoxin component YwqK of YwqJK toxin-antitoxin module|uniref:toxin-antitoxin system YwqK family antitoxin n=1 Tax=Larkinella sp. C7 TaxID=2576607 RepID=UPI0011112F0F|nr:toxin-antitoxin system YwqK family antitoxin [Larkinella sp. C7]
MARRVHFPNKILALLALLVACSDSNESEQMPVVNAADVKIQAQNGVAFADNRPFTGIVYTLWQNKKDTAEIVGFRNGVEHGEWKRFYESGKLMERRFFRNGKKNGDYVAWWPNGRKKLDYHFENGEYHGVCKEWSESGLLLKEMTYKQGYEEGRQKAFYDNGKVKANYIISEGRRYGLLGTKNCVNVADSVFKN